ncbi:hypothetical protein QJS10_CPB21g00830 [Acorus calamus]|uniref:PGG domain-containing protein n=1 Tax=Acorus calamus TaxID=4465 RepID=A0AAV9C6N6_ACOCL|nr:hypothetical protein QJS10_CPB21g00830 [Acorus calamus]
MPQAVCLKINLKGNTALHEAMRFRRTKVAMALLGFDPRLADGLNHAGESPLYLACELRMMVVVESIFSCGSTFRIEGLNGRTPLHASSISGHFASRPHTTCMILDYCPDVGELRDRCGRNALHISVRHNSLKKLEALMKRPELGGLVNKPDNDGNTPLHIGPKIPPKPRRGPIPNPEAAKVQDPPIEPKRGRLEILLRDHVTGRGPFSDHQLRRGLHLPGGYNSDNPNKGHATLIKRLALKAFLLSDTTTFCSSLTLAILMLCGTLGDLVFLRSNMVRVVADDIALWIFSGVRDGLVRGDI